MRRNALRLLRPTRATSSPQFVARKERSVFRDSAYARPGIRVAPSGSTDIAMQRTVGWVEAARPKPINSGCARGDGFRYALPILQVRRSTRSADQARSAVIRRMGGRHIRRNALRLLRPTRATSSPQFVARKERSVFRDSAYARPGIRVAPSGSTDIAMQRTVGWVEAARPKPINSGCARGDGFRYALPILQVRRSTRSADQARSAVIRRMGGRHIRRNALRLLRPVKVGRS